MKMSLSKQEIKDLPDGTVWLNQVTYDSIYKWGRKETSLWGKIFGWGIRVAGKAIWHVTKSAFMHTGVIHNGKQWHWLGGKGLTNDFHSVSTAFIYKEGLTQEQHDLGTKFLEGANKDYNYGRLIMLAITIIDAVKKFFNKIKWFFFSLRIWGENCSAGASKYLKVMNIDAIEELIEDLETPKDIFENLRDDDRFILIGENFDNYNVWRANKK
jgi:hypothetical protein